MERGVDSVVCKQGGRFFDVKRRPFHCKETLSSIERRRFFHFKILLPLYLSGIGVHVNGTIHAPLHSERGKGVRLQSRDRRPRLSAHLPFHDIPIDNIPSFGGAWGGFYLLCFGGQTRASVPTLWHYIQPK